MTTAPGRNRCVTCNKDKATLRCGGCLKEFCFNHSTDHRQELSKQLEVVETNYNVFQQKIIDQTGKLQNDVVIKEVNDWENESIKIIQQKAQAIKQAVVKYTTDHMKQMEVDMNKISRELRQYRKENDFYETDLRQWNEDLGKLATQFDNLSNIVLQRNSAMLINSISVVVTSNSVGGVDSSKVSNTVPNNNRVGVKRTESQMNIDTRICYFCGKAGHISRYCFKRRRFEHENGNCHPNCALCRRHDCADFDSDEDS
ncbi:unnamed protein product [Adineta ricciae]|uniref:CCHC-type domain-containing protein n=1 Tax=Adineta ricciae TaxID=249248 RepID=A0A815TL56_ADIRI|nr:unnamed protein product [Adineta ricciae]